jgi:transposase
MEVRNMTNYREILRLDGLGLNHSEIAAGTFISRPTVNKVLKAAAEQGLTWQTTVELSDKELAKRLFPQNDDSKKIQYKLPDFTYVHKEMQKDGVTLQLLWYEYADKCSGCGETPYQLTQFKKHYRDWAIQTKATMHINRKPGEIMEVDWAGTTAKLVDTDTGCDIDAYLFVAALPYSTYTYCEAFLSMNQSAWTMGHVNAYEFIGGVTRILVPDNLKTGVIKHTKEHLELNRSYWELAEHYGTAIIPARVKAPKDKPTAEGAVGDLTTFILAAIRNQRFFSLNELNSEIFDKLYQFNHKPFQKKEGSRAAAFEEEKPFLLPLPKDRFELSEWKTATVQMNYHVEVDREFYSVPHEYIKQKVDVRLTAHTVEVFFDGSRVCSHARLYGKIGQYRTNEAHMPPNHKLYIQWNGDRFRKWADSIGVNTSAVVSAILGGLKIEQQGYRSCMALLKLADTYTPQRLEIACAKALTYTPRPTYKAVQTILKSGQDKLPEEPIKPSASVQHGFVRGADYYAKGGPK